MQYKQCSILTEKETHYSDNTVAGDSDTPNRPSVLDLLRTALTASQQEVGRLKCKVLSTEAIGNGWEDKYNETLVELERVREVVKNQRERIVYLEGATNHAVGTPLTIALDRAEKAEAERDELKAKVHDLHSDKYCPDACKIKTENAQLKEENDRLHTQVCDEYVIGSCRKVEQARTEAVKECINLMESMGMEWAAEKYFLGPT